MHLLYFLQTFITFQVLRKEPEADCVTPSNRLGLKEGHGIPHGEGLDIWQTLEKLSRT